MVVSLDGLKRLMKVCLENLVGLVEGGVCGGGFRNAFLGRMLMSSLTLCYVNEINLQKSGDGKA